MTAKTSKKQLMTLTSLELLAFKKIRKGELADVEEMVRKKEIRVNCLDEEGMNLLDQACFRGDDQLVECLLDHGADVDNRAHLQGYTCLMFAAMSGKAAICQRLLDAGARSHVVNALGKTAAEIAAFVGQHGCVSVINSYIGLNEVEKIVHPNGARSSVQYPPAMIAFVHRLTRTNEVHPVRLALNVMGDEVLILHRKVILNTVDTLFERQMRGREPNEVLSMKLWLIFFTLRELLKFVDGRLQSAGLTADEEPKAVAKTIRAFTKNLIQASPEDAVRPTEDRFLRTAVCSFPYKQSMVYQAIAKMLADVEVGQPPSSYLIICQQLFGIRFVQTASFCLACGVPSASKRCKACKHPYCSIECQKLDWSIHKVLCSSLSDQRNENDAPTSNEKPNELSAESVDPAK